MFLEKISSMEIFSNSINFLIFENIKNYISWQT